VIRSARTKGSISRGAIVSTAAPPTSAGGPVAPTHDGSRETFG
jgi:hypothetical protein